MSARLTGENLVIVTYRRSNCFSLKHPFVGVKRELRAAGVQEITSSASDVGGIGLSFWELFSRWRLIHARNRGQSAVHGGFCAVFATEK